MVNRVGLSCTQPLAVRNITKQSIGFAHRDDDETTSAEKIAGIAEATEQKLVKPVLELGVIGGAAGATGSKVGDKLNTWFEKPINSASEFIGAFLAKHIESKEGLIGKGLNKLKPLVKIATEQGPQTAGYLTNVMKNKSNLAVKCFAGLIGAVLAAKEMPKAEKVVGESLNKLGAAAIAADALT